MNYWLYRQRAKKAQDAMAYAKAADYWEVRRPKGGGGKGRRERFDCAVCSRSGRGDRLTQLRCRQELIEYSRENCEHFNHFYCQVRDTYKGILSCLLLSCSGLPLL